MRVLVLGLDGADRDLVDRLLAEGRLPTLARLVRDGAYGPLRSTIPAVTPTAWSSFLTGLNPAGHGIFNFSSNPNRGRSRVESAASRSGAPLWRLLGAGGVRSAFVTVPFTYPAEAFDGVVVSGYGGPERPQILPEAAARAIDQRVPGLITAHHPMKERWWEDFGRYAATLIAHVDQIGDACRACFELEPDLGVLAVDFMSTDFAGHLGYSRLDPSHPAHDPAASGDELVQVYQAVDRVCGELIDAARERYGEEPTAIIMSDHGMKPIYWTFHANEWLRRAGPPALPAPVAPAVRARAAAQAGPGRRAAGADDHVVRQAARPGPAPATAGRRPGLRRRRLRAHACLLLRHGRPDLPGRGDRSSRRRGVRRAAGARPRGDPPPRDGRAALRGAAEARHLPRRRISTAPRSWC